MKNKKKTRARVLAFLTFALTLVSCFGVSAFAFQYSDLNSAGSYASFDHDLSEPIYTNDYDILPVGGLIQENMQGMIGPVSWDNYGRLPYCFDYADYIANTDKPLFALEFLVVRCEIDQVMGNNQYFVVSDGNFFFPQKDIASYYGNGLRVVSLNDTFRYAFLENFYNQYALPYSEYTGLVKYQLYCVAYHYDFGAASPGTTISMQEYNKLKEKYEDEKSARASAEGQLEVKAKELKESQEQCNSLEAEKNDLIKKNIELQGSNSRLQKSFDDLQKEYNTCKNSLNNSNAVVNFFDGIYKSVSGVLNQFFTLDVFGVSLGSIMAILIAAFVVIVILKIVL